MVWKVLSSIGIKVSLFCLACVYQFGVEKFIVAILQINIIILLLIT